MRLPHTMLEFVTLCTHMVFSMGPPGGSVDCVPACSLGSMAICRCTRSLLVKGLRDPFWILTVTHITTFLTLRNSRFAMFLWSFTKSCEVLWGFVEVLWTVVRVCEGLWRFVKFLWACCEILEGAVPTEVDMGLQFRISEVLWISVSRFVVAWKLSCAHHENPNFPPRDTMAPTLFPFL